MEVLPELGAIVVLVDAVFGDVQQSDRTDGIRRLARGLAVFLAGRNSEFLLVVEGALRITGDDRREVIRYDAMACCVWCWRWMRFETETEPATATGGIAWSNSRSGVHGGWGGCQ